MAFNVPNMQTLSNSVPRAPLAMFNKGTSPTASCEIFTTVNKPEPSVTTIKDSEQIHSVEVNVSSHEPDLQSSETAPQSWVRWRQLSYGWVVVFAAIIINFIQEGLQYSVSIMFEPFTQEFNATKAETAWVPSIFLSMPHLGAPLSSNLVNRYGCRRMAILGGIVAAISVGFSSLSTSLVSIFFFYGIVGGFGISLFDVASNSILSQYFVKNLSFVSGIAVSAGGLGLVCLMPLMDFLLENYGWRYTKLVCAAIYSLISLCGLLLRPSDKNSNLVSLNNGSEEQIKVGRKEKFFRSSRNYIKCTPTEMLEPLRYKSFVIFAVSNFMLYLFYDLPYVYMPKDAHIKTFWLICIMGLLNIVGQIVLGWLGDRECVNPQIVYGVSMVLAGAAVSVIPIMRTPLSISITSAFFGLVISGHYALTNIIISSQIISHFPDYKKDKTKEMLLQQKFTNSYGLLSLIQGIGNIIGPPIAGHLLELYDSPNYIYLIAGLTIIISGMLMFIWPIFNYFKKTSFIIPVITISSPLKITVSPQQEETEY